VSLQLSDPATGWSFTCETNATGKKVLDDGLVLQEVRHDGHNFAKDIRVIGLRMFVETIDPTGKVVSVDSEFLRLRSHPFEVGDIKELKPVATAMPKPSTGTFKYLQEADEALFLKSYFRDEKDNYVAYGVRCDYKLEADELETWPNAEFAGLTVSQIFLFSRYGNSPPHEPSGGLSAARCHPMTKFQLTPNPGVDKKKNRFRVRSIRFDYRVHLSLDRHHDVATNAGLAQIGNQAGLFRDEETVSIVAAASRTPRGIVGAIGGSEGAGSQITGAAFAAAEKPLVLEVTAPGLALGVSVYDDGSRTRTCWDNIHWWGSRGKGEPLISAPGAFHAAHVHWRWGTAASTIRFRKPTIDTTGTPDAASGDPAAGNISGALTDPRIWMQTIRVAATTADRLLEPGLNLSEDLSPTDWKTAFTRLRSSPGEIEDGANIVLWYSVEANREVVFPGATVRAQSPAPGVIPGRNPSHTTPPRRFEWSAAGTVFLHGIFFAHDAEKTGFLSVGNRKPEHFPKSASSIRKEKQWFRSA
jgi:hypothetical protein